MRFSVIGTKQSITPSSVADTLFKHGPYYDVTNNGVMNQLSMRVFNDLRFKKEDVKKQWNDLYIALSTDSDSVNIVLVKKDGKRVVKDCGSFDSLRAYLMYNIDNSHKGRVWMSEDELDVIYEHLLSFILDNYEHVKEPVIQSPEKKVIEKIKELIEEWNV